MADDHTARLTARQERIRQKQVADANQQLIDRMINTLVGVIGHQNNTQADTNCLIQDWRTTVAPAPDCIIDYSTKEGSYLYKAVRASFYEKGKAKFNCTQEHLPHFIELLKRGACKASLL
jgi:hypothetical protein